MTEQEEELEIRKLSAMLKAKGITFKDADLIVGILVKRWSIPRMTEWIQKNENATKKEIVDAAMKRLLTKHSGKYMSIRTIYYYSA